MSNSELIIVISSIILNVCACLMLSYYFDSNVFNYLLGWTCVNSTIFTIIKYLLHDNNNIIKTFNFNKLIVNLTSVFNLPTYLYILYAIHKYNASYFADFMIILYIIFYSYGLYILNTFKVELPIEKRKYKNGDIIKSAEIEK